MRCAHNSNKRLLYQQSTIHNPQSHADVWERLYRNRIVIHDEADAPATTTAAENANANANASTTTMTTTTPQLQGWTLSAAAKETGRYACRGRWWWGSTTCTVSSCHSGRQPRSRSVVVVVLWWFLVLYQRSHGSVGCVWGYGYEFRASLSCLYVNVAGCPIYSEDEENTLLASFDRPGTQKVKIEQTEDETKVVGSIEG